MKNFGLNVLVHFKDKLFFSLVFFSSYVYTDFPLYICLKYFVLSAVLKPHVFIYMYMFLMFRFMFPLQNM